MTDAKKFSFYLAEPLAEGEIDEFKRVIDERIGVEPLSHCDGGQRIGIFRGILREEFKPCRFDGSAAGFGEPCVAEENIVKPFFEEHFKTFV